MVECDSGHTGGEDKFGYASVMVDPQRPGVVMVSTMDRWTKKDDLFRSADGGKTWKPIGAKATRDSSASPWVTWGRDHAELGHWIGDIEIDPFDSDRVMYVTGTRVWASRDVTRADNDEPTHWEVASSGIEECVVNEVVSPPSGATLLSVMWDIDGFRHEDLDVSPPQGFFKPGFGHNRAIDFAENDPNFVVRVYDNGKTHGAYSNDNGRTWQEFERGAGGKGGTVAVAADGRAIVWTPENAPPHRSIDCGKTWMRCEGNGSGTRVVSDRVNPGSFYAFDRSGKALLSDQAGLRFVPGAGDLPPGDGFVRAVPGHAGHVWLAKPQGLFVSRDTARSFARIEGIDSAHRIGFGKAAPNHDYPAIYLSGKTHVAAVLDRRAAYPVSRGDPDHVAGD